MSFKDFDPKPVFRSFRRLVGEGEVGGKARGLAFAYSVITGSAMEPSVVLPDINYVITTEVFSEFVKDNAVHELLERTLADAPESEEETCELVYERMRTAFETGTVRAPLLSELGAILDNIGDIPLAIRSSSILEDSTKLSFAGKYGTFFSANVGSREERILGLTTAIRNVWASLYNPAARAYRKKHGLTDDDESMAVVVQPVMGTPHGHLYYPEIAGTAFSKVYRRPSTRIRKEDGVVRFCFGLGTRTVDRLKATVAYLSHPSLRPQGNLPSDIAQTSQSEFDYLDRKTGSFMSGLLSDFLPYIMKEHPMASAFIEIFADNNLYWAGSDQLRNGVPIFSFSAFPSRHPRFFSLLKELAAFLEEQMGRPADMEFTYDTKDGKLTVLQLRPLAAYEEMAKVRIPADWADRTLLRGNRMVSNGRMEHVEHLVYVDPFVYGKDTTFYEVAREIGRINERLGGTNYILVGPGRWGSTNPKLGVPVRYNEICHCGCLIEVGITASDYMPELSYGTHFFLDLDVDGILYLPVFDGIDGNIFNREWFEGTPYQVKQHPAVRHYVGDFSVHLDGDKEIGVVLAESPTYTLEI